MMQGKKADDLWYPDAESFPTVYTCVTKNNDFATMIFIVVQLTGWKGNECLYYRNDEQL